MTNETRKRSIRVEDSLWGAARAETSRRGETVTAVITRALLAYVAPEEYQALKNARDAFYGEMSGVPLADIDADRYKELHKELRRALAALDEAVWKVVSAVRVPASWG